VSRFVNWCWLTMYPGAGVGDFRREPIYNSEPLESRLMCGYSEGTSLEAGRVI